MKKKVGHLLCESAEAVWYFADRRREILVDDRNERKADLCRASNDRRRVILVDDRNVILAADGRASDC